MTEENIIIQGTDQSHSTSVDLDGDLRNMEYINHGIHNETDSNIDTNDNDNTVTTTNNNNNINNDNKSQLPEDETTNTREKIPNQSQYDHSHSISEQTVNTQEQQMKQKSKTSAMAMWVGLLTAVGGFLYGYDTGIINGLLEMTYVKAHFANDGLSFTAKETSLITGILSVGTFFGSLFAPVISDRFGRRLSIVGCTSVIFTLGTILQLISKSSAVLCVGRFISGFGVGVISAITPLYQAEASPKWIRGSVISLYQWAITWGLLVSSAITQASHHLNDPRCYRIPIGIQLIWGACLSFGMYMLPESPRFYVKKDLLDNAIVSLSKFRRLPVDDETLIEELIEIKASHDYEMSFGKSSIWDCFKSSPSRARQGKRMMTGMVLQALQQASGINFIFYYGVNFFVKAGIANSYIISFITYAVNVVFTIPGIFFVEIWGRRKLLVVGAAGMSVSNLVIAIVGVTTDSIIANKIMIAFLCSFIAFFAATWGPLVWVLVGEMYSLGVRQKAVSITAATNWMVNFVFAYCTAFLIDSGSHTAALGTKIFFLWGGLNFVGFIFAYFYVYETKGLMLEEVDELFRVCGNARKSALFRPGLVAMEHTTLDDPEQQQHNNNRNGDEDTDGGIEMNFVRKVSDSQAIDSSTTPESSQDHNSNIMFRDSSLATDYSYDLNHHRLMGTYPPLVESEQTNNTNNNNNTTATAATTNNNNNQSIIMNNILNIPNSMPPSISSTSDDELDEFVLDHQAGLDLGYYLNEPSNDYFGGEQPSFDNPLPSIIQRNRTVDGSGATEGEGNDSEASEYSYTNQEELIDFIQRLGVGSGSSSTGIIAQPRSSSEVGTATGSGIRHLDVPEEAGEDDFSDHEYDENIMGDDS